MNNILEYNISSDGNLDWKFEPILLENENKDRNGNQC